MSERERGALYAATRERLERLLDGEDDWIAALTTIASELHHAFERFSWTGFYRVTSSRPDVLVVGPYQGGHGCARIPFSRGVCGAAARSRKTQRVDDVCSFDGYIACSGDTRSELVVPVVGRGGDVLGVLDVDSDTLAAFDATDETQLGAICRDLAKQFPHGELRG